MSRSILVLGAGIVGVSCALALQQRGFAVTLLDRREPGRETSYGNAGVIGRSSLVPLNNPGLYAKLPGYLGNRHPALHLDWRRALTSPGWMLRFLWEARPSQAVARIAAMDGLTATAVTLHRALMQQAGISHRLRETGTLKLWRSEAGLAAARAEQALLQAHGIASEILDRQGISALEPSLRPIFPTGLFIEANGSVDSPGAVTAGYAALFVARGGTLVQDEVTALRREGSLWRVQTAQRLHEAGDVVVALGPWSADLLRPLGLDPKLDVERGYHRHFATSDGARLSRPVYDVDAAYFMTPMEEGYRVTSGVDLSRRDAPDQLRQIESVTQSAREAFPLGAIRGKTWRGARPTLPDSLPMIGAAPGHQGLWLAFGNQHLGFSTGPMTGELLAALLNGETPPIDPKPYAPGRYL
ncbi:FAD-dependent oxidoreductase [Bosea sp. (in: a-proteobacteria)]|uniref:NAD(P)/FAD-dependent oxidoreductase n=1 Tax=Bosea sp. (in: a-proteobacteria) TaxID=1871050 RepID=UPI001ACDFB77|nr:FAD-dependent oxidoreductase [Bosea sp. (in: a-proteobacteria)]MBN9440636.1 FAD-dependent oxidoreductase [Bosea sp. (in: a-proteobacteria)]